MQMPLLPVVGEQGKQGGATKRKNCEKLTFTQWKRHFVIMETLVFVLSIFYFCFLVFFFLPKCSELFCFTLPSSAVGAVRARGVENWSMCA